MKHQRITSFQMNGIIYDAETGTPVADDYKGICLVLNPNHLPNIYRTYIDWEYGERAWVYLRVWKPGY